MRSTMTAPDQPDACPLSPADHCAYLMSRHPTVTTAFIAEEMRALRNAGTRIDTVAIWRARADALISVEQRREAAATRALLPAKPGRLLRDHLAALVRSPGAYLRTIARALRMGRGVRPLVWQLFYFAEAMMLWRLLEPGNVRHVHVHFSNVASDVALLATYYGRLTGGRWTWSVTLHGPDEFSDIAAYRIPQKVEAADAVVCISDFARSQVMACTDSAHWSKLAVVRCGVDTKRFAPRGTKPPSGRRVLCVAALSARKGQAVLLDAAATLLERGNPIAVTLVGDGPERPRLEVQAARLGIDVVFRGALDHEAVRACYADADVFCLPAFAEGLPVVLMEAMASGVPVVATRINGVPELVEDGTSGLLVTPGRADLLADAIDRLLGDDTLRERFGTEGRAVVKSRHELGATAAELRSVFERIGAEERVPSATAVPFVGAL